MSSILWLFTASWLASCGRLEFDALVPSSSGDLADAPLGEPPADATPADAVPTDIAPAPAAALEVADTLALTTQCGANPSTAPTQLAVKNTGTADLVIDSASLPTDSKFRLTLIPTQIAPGATAMITVVPPMAVVGTDRANAQFSETLTLKTNAGDRAIALTASVLGANIDLQTPAGATALSFIASSGCPAPQNVVVKNTGNASINIDALVANGVAFSGFSGGAIPPGATRTTMVRPFTVGQCAASGTLGYEPASGASGLCATTVLQVTLSLSSSSGASCFCS